MNSDRKIKYPKSIKNSKHNSISNILANDELAMNRPVSVKNINKSIDLQNRPQSQDMNAPVRNIKTMASIEKGDYEDQDAKPAVHFDLFNKRQQTKI